ncbi:MAG: hypothetical protein K0R13_3407 [Propionibacteriaceae bacterium]|nr:hypothetical protein [Propionibacteriaceae bacterium]
MPMLKRSKTLTGTVPVCLRSGAGTNEPCRLIPGRAAKGHSQSAAWADMNSAATRPRDPVGINCFDTPLIPYDTPMTRKRQLHLLPRGPRRHLIGLRHIASFGSPVARSSGQLILDRSFTHLFEVALAQRALEADSVRRSTRDEKRVSLIAPALAGGALRRSRNRPSRSRLHLPLLPLRCAPQCGSVAMWEVAGESPRQDKAGSGAGAGRYPDAGSRGRRRPGQGQSDRHLRHRPAYRVLGRMGAENSAATGNGGP